MAKHSTLFITDRTAIHQQLAKDAAPDVLDIKMLVSPDQDQILDALETTEFLISERSGTIGVEHFSAAPNLRLVQRLGTQVHDINLEAAQLAEIPVCNWPLAQSALVAEHTMMQILGLIKKLRDGMEVVAKAEPWGDGSKKCDANTFNMNWSERKGIQRLHRSTVGIFGFGEIGTQLAALLNAFDCTVLYNRRSRLPVEAEKRLNVRYAKLDELLAKSDTVCCLLPHSDETEGSVNAAFIESMKPGAMLVNTGASTSFDEEAVAAGYRSGHLGGVAADGHRWEPVRADDPLVELSRDRSANVLLTPHSAQGNIQLTAAARVVEFTNLLSTIEGRALQHRVI